MGPMTHHSSLITRHSLPERVVAGDRRAIARALSVVERGDAAATALIGALFPHTGRAHLVGVTGAGGVGKSSLIAALIGQWRRLGRSVGVVAVDPTSALSGGALLGDPRALRTLRAAFHLAPGQPPPLLKASAATGAGIGELADALDAHLAWLSTDGRRERRAQDRARAELARLLREELLRVALA